MSSESQVAYFSKERIIAFSDGYFAVILSIMVLALKAVPERSTGDWNDLLQPDIGNVFLSYVLSFLMGCVYWMNHHHYMSMIPRVTSGVMWINMVALFVISLLPFATQYMS
jgi:uncharacterized membrane protein